MTERVLTAEKIEAYGRALRAGERAPGTIGKYLHDAASFAAWLRGREVTRETALEWKEHLQSMRYKPTTINGMLSALNGLFRTLGWDDCRVRFLKVQRRLFRDTSRQLSREEYEALVSTARARGRERLALVMETICSARLRVSELKYITVEAARQGRTDIFLKGKIRTVILPRKLCRKLLKYAKKQKTASGEIFLTGNGKSLQRRQIWAEMKSLCRRAGVEATKVFPHNLRHLFATAFYRACRDIVRLADVLGHSSIETTRIYLLTTGDEHRRELERLRLVL